MYKYIRNQDQMDTMAQSIFDRYFGPKGQGINIDDEILRTVWFVVIVYWSVQEIEEKIKAPTRTTFMLIQNAIWGLLKLDCFPKFKDSGDIADKLKQKVALCLNETHQKIASEADNCGPSRRR